MQKITVSAPGKLILFGEHAVVHNHSCIVTAVDERLFVTAEKITEPLLTLDAPDVDLVDYKKPLAELGTRHIPKEAEYVERAVKNFCDAHHTPDGIRISTTSDFSANLGFGSSSAAVVCTLFALFSLFDIPFTKKHLLAMAHKTVLDVKNVGSGADTAAALFGGTLLYNRMGPIVEELPRIPCALVIGYTGTKADTANVLKKISAEMKNDGERIAGIYASMTRIVEKAKTAFRNSDSAELGKLATQNQKLLSDLGVSSKILDTLINATISADAYGAKLSGAGIGDCMFALCAEDKKEAVAAAVEEAGGKHIDVAIHAKGVRIES